jgi:hypothetical protein
VWNLASVILREEHRFRVFRRTFEPKREEIRGGWRKLHNEELHNLYFSPNIMRIIGYKIYTVRTVDTTIYLKE